MSAAAAHPTRDRGPAHGAGDPPALHAPAHLVPRPPLVVSELDVVRWPAAPSRRRCPSTSTPMAGRACRLSPSPRTSSTRTSAADEQYRSQPSGRPLRLDVRAEISSGDRDPGLGQPPTSFSNGRRGCPGATTPPAPMSSGSVSTAIRRPVSSGMPGPDETYESTGVAHSVPRPSPDLEERRPAPPPAAGRRRPSTSSRCWPLLTEPADHAVVVAHRPAGLTPAGGPRAYPSRRLDGRRGADIDSINFLIRACGRPERPVRRHVGRGVQQALSCSSRSAMWGGTYQIHET